MTSTPDTSRNIFDEDKRYFGSALQQGVPVFDWDVNETTDELKWFIMTNWRAFLGENLENGFRFQDSDGNKGFEIIGDGTSNNFDINPAANVGAAIVKGRLVYFEGQFAYNQNSNTPVNYIIKGKITGIVENTAGADYTLADTEKVLTANHDLDGATLRFTSGTLSGNEYVIDSRLSATTFQVLDDLSSAAVADSYVIKPRALSTPPGPGTQTDTIYLVTWFEDISSNEDSTLIDLTPVDTDLHVEPSHRKQLRWAVIANWTGSDGTDILEDFFALELATIERPSAQANVNAGDVTNSDTFVYTQEYLTKLSNQIEGVTLTAFDWKELLNNAITYDFTVSGLTYNRSFDTGAGKWHTSHYLEPTSKNIVSKASGTTANATSGNSWFSMDIAANGLSVSDNQNTSGEIDDNEIVYLAINDDTSNIINAFPMGNIPVKQGFDWICFRNATDYDLYVMPGQLEFNGQLLQMPTEVSLDAEDSANLLTSGSFSSANDWVYVYVVQTVVNGKRLTVKLDLVEPLWDGRHPSPPTGQQAFCIGFIRYTSSNEPHYDTSCRNNKITFGSPTSSGNTYFQIVAIGTAASTDALDVPVGAANIDLEIFAENITATALAVDLRNRLGSTTTWEKTNVLTTTSGYERTSQIAPCNWGELQAVTDATAWSAGNIDFHLRSIDFQYNYMPKPSLWFV